MAEGILTIIVSEKLDGGLALIVSLFSLAGSAWLEGLEQDKILIDAMRQIRYRVFNLFIKYIFILYPESYKAPVFCQGFLKTKLLSEKV